MNARATAAGSGADVTAAATATRVMPSAASSSSRSSVTPPIANAGKAISAATVRRNSGGANPRKVLVVDAKQGPMPRKSAPTAAASRASATSWAVRPSSALSAVRARDRLTGVNLCVLVDGGTDGATFSRLVESLVEAGVRMLQIRDKRLATPALVDRVGRALAIARRRPPEEAVFVIVNDRVDVAAAVGAVR